MAQNFVPKETAFVQNYVAAVTGLLNLTDQLIALDTQFTQNTYGTGGANAIIDSTVQAVCPAATAAIFNSAEGAVVTILATIATNRGYLEALRQ